jgi:hypothetical protein
MFENEMKMAVMLAWYGGNKDEMARPYMGLKNQPVLFVCLVE